VPDEEWDAIVTYYRQNKDKPKLERWGKANVYTNNLEAPSYMVRWRWRRAMQHVVCCFLVVVADKLLFVVVVVV
jgi:hypothetical protein